MNPLTKAAQDVLAERERQIAALRAALVTLKGIAESARVHDREIREARRDAATEARWDERADAEGTPRGCY